MSTFKSAGVSRLNGKMSFRCTNREDPIYPNILKKDGHTDIHIVQLPSPMTKEEARKHLPRLKAFQTPEILACLKQEDKPKKEAKKTAAKKAKASPPKKAAKKPATATKTKKKDDPLAAEVANNERAAEDTVDVAAELGNPSFLKHTEGAE